MLCSSCGNDRPLNKDRKCINCAGSQPIADNTFAIIGGILGFEEGGVSGAIEGALIGSLLDD